MKRTNFYFEFPYCTSLLIFILIAFTISSCNEESTDPNNGNDIIHSTKITSDETWCDNEIHYVEGIVTVENAILTICEGTTVYFKEDARLIIDANGALIVGSEADDAKLVLLTSDGTAWDKVEFRDDARSSTSLIANTKIEKGGSKNSMLQVDCELKLKNVILDNSTNTGMEIENSASLDIDSLFITNSNQEPIIANFSTAHNVSSTTYFENNGKNYINLSQGSIKENATWSAVSIPYLVNGGANVIDNALLTIEKSCEILMNSDARIIVDEAAGFYADGEDENGTIYISALIEQKGYWDKIELRDDADFANCKFNFCNIEYGGSKNAMIYSAGNDFEIKNSTISKSGKYGIYLDRYAQPNIQDIIITECDDAPIFLHFNNIATVISGDFQGNTNDYLEVEGGVIDSDSYLEKFSVPWRFIGSINEINGATLTIAPGTVIESASGSRILIDDGGGLIADGTTEAITFTATVKQNGYWRTIEIRDDVNNTDCIFKNCIIEYGGGGQGLFELRACSPTISNCTLQYSGTCGIYMNNQASPILENNTFNSNTDDDICQY